MEESSVFNVKQNATDFIRTLQKPDQKYKKPITIILVGIPASGKSYFCQNIVSSLPFVLVSENSIQSFLVPRITFFKRGTGQILDFAKETVKQLTQMGFNSVLDMNLKTFAQREMFRLIVQEASGEVVTIHLTRPKEVCFDKIKKRNLEIQRGDIRGLIMDWDYFLFEVNGTEEPIQSENAIAYDSSTNGNQIAKIAKYLEDKLEGQDLQTTK
jgi:predicted kinase